MLLSYRGYWLMVDGSLIQGVGLLVEQSLQYMRTDIPVLEGNFS
jgi:hypothetical protein